MLNKRRKGPWDLMPVLHNSSHVKFLFFIILIFSFVCVGGYSLYFYFVSFCVESTTIKRIRGNILLLIMFSAYI